VESAAGNRIGQKGMQAARMKREFRINEGIPTKARGMGTTLAFEGIKRQRCIGISVA
jgi:hypothetical protein